MIRKMLIVLVSSAMLGAPGTAANSLPIEWSISPAGIERGSEKVQLTLTRRLEGNGRSMQSRPLPLAELQGLSQAQLDSAGSPASFRIVREAGVLDCQGVVRQHRGTGECSFAPDARFASELERRGIGRPTEHQQFQLAIQNVRLALVADLERQGYERPSVGTLTAASIRGVSLSYLQSLEKAGYRLGTLNDAIKFRIHGVDASYLRELAGLRTGNNRFSPDEVVAMRIHGVSPSFIRQMAAEGYRGLSAKQLVTMRIHGVTPAFAREMRGAAGDLPSAGELVAMRIHGLRSRRRR